MTSRRSFLTGALGSTAVIALTGYKLTDLIVATPAPIPSLDEYMKPIIAAAIKRAHDQVLANLEEAIMYGTGPAAHIWGPVPSYHGPGLVDLITANPT